jgi:hypothetical protein
MKKYVGSRLNRGALFVMATDGPIQFHGTVRPLLPL